MKSSRKKDILIWKRKPKVAGLTSVPRSGDFNDGKGSDLEEWAAGGGRRRPLESRLLTTRTYLLLTLLEGGRESCAVCTCVCVRACVCGSVHAVVYTLIPPPSLPCLSDLHGGEYKVRCVLFLCFMEITAYV